jgi:hypothetical protein
MLLLLPPMLLLLLQTPCVARSPRQQPSGCSRHVYCSCSHLAMHYCLTGVPLQAMTFQFSPMTFQHVL